MSYVTRPHVITPILRCQYIVKGFVSLLSGTLNIPIIRVEYLQLVAYPLNIDRVHPIQMLGGYYI